MIVAGYYFCGACGDPLGSGEKFCGSCGWSVPNPAEDPLTLENPLSANTPPAPAAYASPTSAWADPGTLSNPQADLYRDVTGTEPATNQPTPGLIVLTRIFAWGMIAMTILAIPLTLFLGFYGFVMGLYGFGMLIYYLLTLLVCAACIALVTGYRALTRTTSRWPFIVAIIGITPLVLQYLPGLPYLVRYVTYYFDEPVMWAQFFLWVATLFLYLLGLIVCIRWLLILRSPKSLSPTSGYYVGPTAVTPSVGIPATYGASSGYAMLPTGIPYRRASRATYLWPILFGFIGGLLGWAIVKDHDPVLGRHVLITGIIIGVLVTVVPVLFYVVLIVYYGSTSGF